MPIAVKIKSIATIPSTRCKGPLFSTAQAHCRKLADCESHHAKRDEEATGDLEPAALASDLPDTHAERHHEPLHGEPEGD